MMDIDFIVASIAQNPDCILLCCYSVACMRPLCSLHASDACTVHAVYVYLIYLLAAQCRMQPSRDTVYFVVRM